VTDDAINVDLAPTILDAANVRPGLAVDGRSLLPLARDRLADDGRDVLLETPQYSAIRTDRYKYVEYRTGERELYDLRTDPNELQSRQDDPALATLRSELARRLAVLRTCKGAACRQGPRLALRTSCGARFATLRVSGADGRWVSVTRFYVNGRRVATDTKAPFSARTARRSTVARAHVQTSDGRGVTLATRVRCR
jgi:hypothetical protein